MCISKLCWMPRHIMEQYGPGKACSELGTGDSPRLGGNLVSDTPRKPEWVLTSLNYKVTLFTLTPL